MSYDDPQVRRAFIVGAKAAYENLLFYVPERERDSIQSWLDQLEAWEDGDPPLPPNPWKALLP